MDAIVKLDLSDVLKKALMVSPKGVALVERLPGSWKILWGNKSFCAMSGIDEASPAGKSGLQVWSSVGGSREDWESSMRQGTSWSGSLGTASAGKFQAQIDAVSDAHALVWFEREPGGDSLRERLEEVLRKVQEISSVDEKTGLSGPKSFWRCVGAVWGVCSRNEISVSLGLITLKSGETQSLEKEMEDAANKTLAKSFRRSSDVVGRLTHNSFAIFVVGQSEGWAQEKMAEVVEELGVDRVSGVALACGIPMNGSSTQSIKILGKKLLDASLAQNGEISFEGF